MESILPLFWDPGPTEEYWRLALFATWHEYHRDQKSSSCFSGNGGVWYKESVPQNARNIHDCFFDEHSSETVN